MDDPLALELEAIRRGISKAELLRQQAVEPRRIGSITQGLAQLAQAFVAGRAGQRADKRLVDFQEKNQKAFDTQNEALSSALTSIQSGEDISPEVSARLDPKVRTAIFGSVLKQKSSERTSAANREQKLSDEKQKKVDLGQARIDTLDRMGKPTDGLDPFSVGSVGTGVFQKEHGLTSEGQTINISTQQQTAFQKELGKKEAQTFVARNEAADQAITSNINLSRIGQALDKGSTTGFGAETLLNIKSLANTFGVDLESGLKALGIKSGNLTEEQVVRAVGNQLALQMSNPKSGFGLKGSTSNRDIILLKSTVPGLQQTPDGNRAIILTAKKINDYKIAIAQEQNRLIDENDGKRPKGFNKNMLEFENNYEVFTPVERAQLKTLSMTPEQKQKRIEELIKNRDNSRG